VRIGDFQVSRIAYFLVVVLGAISIASLAFALNSANDRIDDTTDRLEGQLRLVEATLVAECRTRKIIRALTVQTIALLESQPPTPARLRTIGVFRGYVVLLSSSDPCNRLERRNP
jgi:hypothetical protein